MDAVRGCTGVLLPPVPCPCWWWTDSAELLLVVPADPPTKPSGSRSSPSSFSPPPSATASPSHVLIAAQTQPNLQALQWSSNIGLETVYDYTWWLGTEDAIGVCSMSQDTTSTVTEGKKSHTELVTLSWKWNPAPVKHELDEISGSHSGKYCQAFR
jgi:hypothetical protein